MGKDAWQFRYAWPRSWPSTAPTCTRSQPIGGSARRHCCSARAGLRKTSLWSSGCWTTVRAQTCRISRLRLATFNVTAERHTTSPKHSSTGAYRLTAQAAANALRCKRSPTRGITGRLPGCSRHGAEVNARAHGGRTAAHFAAERNTGPKTLSLLVENGADLWARDDDGLTPLEIARRNEKPRLVEWIATQIRAKPG